MKKCIMLLCFLTITCSQHAMKHDKEEYETIEIENTDNAETIEQNTLEFPTKQWYYKLCTNKKVKTIAEGTGTAALSFTIIEAFGAGLYAALGNAQVAIHPVFLYINGLASVMIGLCYISGMIHKG